MALSWVFLLPLGHHDNLVHTCSAGWSGIRTVWDYQRCGGLAREAGNEVGHLYLQLKAAAHPEPVPGPIVTVEATLMYYEVTLVSAGEDVDGVLQRRGFCVGWAAHGALRRDREWEAQEFTIPPISRLAGRGGFYGLSSVDG